MEELPEEDFGIGGLFGELEELDQIKLKDKQTHLGVQSEVLFQDDLQERVEKYLNKKMQKLGKTDLSKIFKQNNIQTTNNLQQIKKKILINDINEGVIAGFSSAESNIQHLKDINFEKNFIVESAESVVEYYKFYNTKSLLMKVFHADNFNDSEQSKESLFAFINQILDEQAIDEKVKIGLDSGFKFALTMISEIRNLNQQSLQKSLEFIYSTLKMSSPGSLYGIDKMAFMIDSNLNQAREFILSTFTEFVEKKDQTDQSKEIVSICLKILLLMGIVRYSVEDLLLVPTLLDKYDISVDLVEELQILQQNIKKQDVSDEGSKNSYKQKIIKSIPIFYFKSGKNKKNPIKLNYNCGLACDGTFIYVHQKEKGLIKLGSGNGGTTFGQVYLTNEQFMKDQEVTLMIHNQRLYCRTASIKPKPFVCLNPLTLEQEKDEINYPKNNVLDWDDNKFTGRNLSNTPLITDGTNIYIFVQRYKPKLQPKTDT